MGRTSCFHASVFISFLLQSHKVLWEERHGGKVEDVPPRFHPLPQEQVMNPSEAARSRRLQKLKLTAFFSFCFRFLRSHALNTRYRDIYRPSTGASMLLAALHTCDQVGVGPVNQPPDMSELAERRLFLASLNSSACLKPSAAVKPDFLLMF